MSFRNLTYPSLMNLISSPLSSPPPSSMDKLVDSFFSPFIPDSPDQLFFQMIAEKMADSVSCFDPMFVRNNIDRIMPLVLTKLSFQTPSFVSKGIWADCNEDVKYTKSSLSSSEDLEDSGSFMSSIDKLSSISLRSKKSKKKNRGRQQPTSLSPLSKPFSPSTVNSLNEFSCLASHATSRSHPQSFGPCVFCKNNGTSEDVCSSHSFRFPDGRVKCPILRRFQCPICGNRGGDHAHTKSHCPFFTGSTGGSPF